MDSKLTPTLDYKFMNKICSHNKCCMMWFPVCNGEIIFVVKDKRNAIPQNEFSLLSFKYTRIYDLIDE